MFSITAFALDNLRITWLVILGAVVLGGVLFIDYPKQEDPTITIREAVVTARFPGMSTRRIEDLITRKLEEKIREIPEVDEIRSDSKVGVSHRSSYTQGRDERYRGRLAGSAQQDVRSGARLA